MFLVVVWVCSRIQTRDSIHLYSGVSVLLGKVFDNDILEPPVRDGILDVLRFNGRQAPRK